MPNNFIKYPSCIIPKPKYAIRLNIDQLIEKYDILVIRRIDKKATRNNAGNLHPMGIYTGDVPDMSTNLFGAYFVANYAKFKTKGAASSDWNGQHIDIKNYANDYELAGEHSLIYIPIRPLHKISIPYKTTFNKAFVNNNKQFMFERKEDVMYASAVTEIIHMPTILNYWHVILEVKDASIAQPIKNPKNQVSRSICDTIIENIISKISRETVPNEIYKIDKSFILRPYQTASY